MKYIVSLIIVLLIVANFFFDLDQHAMDLHQESFERAMVAFGLAKGLNGIISLLQGTEFSLTPVGVGLTFSIGEILDPLNDLVERFSWVMLFASISLGVQKLLLLLSTKMLVQVALGVSAFFLLFCLWIEKLHRHAIFLFALKSFVFLLIIRLSAVVFILTSQAFYDNFLAIEYGHATEVLTTAQETLQKVHAATLESSKGEEEKSFFQKVQGQYDSLIQSLNISKKFDALKDDMQEASVNVINMMTLFLVQTLLMPLLYLWFLYGSIKAIFHLKIENERVYAFLNPKQNKLKI